MTTPTVTTNGQTPATPSEPPMTAAPPEPERPKQAHSAPTKEQIKANWRARPKWFRWTTTAISAVLGSYIIWSFIIGPRLDSAASKAADKGVQEKYAANSETMVSVLVGWLDPRIDQKVAAVRDGIGPVVVVDAPLAWLPCPIGLNAQGFIGANTDPAAQSKLNVQRAQRVETAVQAAQAQGAALTSLRVTLNPKDGGPDITTNAGEGVPLMDCTAKAAAPAPATPATTAAPSTPVTPPKAD